MSCPSPQRYTPASADRSVLCTRSGSDTTTICWVPSPASSTSRWTGVTTTSAPSSWPASCGTAGRWNSPSRRPWSVLPTSVRSISSGRSTRGTWGPARPRSGVAPPSPIRSEDQLPGGFLSYSGRGRVRKRTGLFVCFIVLSYSGFRTWLRSSSWASPHRRSRS